MTRAELRDELAKALDLVAKLRAELAASNGASEDHVFESALHVALQEARALGQRFANPSYE